MANLAPMFKYRATDLNGDPLSGGKLWTYAPGTTTPKATYTDQSGLTPNTNPVILDANGEADVWLGPGYYKIVLTGADDVTLYTVDKVSAGGGSGDIDANYNYDGYSSRFSQIFTSVGLSDTLDKILLITYTAPQISISGSSNVLREKGTSVSNVTLTATITKRSDPIQEVRFYQNPSTLLDTQTSGGAIPSGGASTYLFAGPFSDNITFRAEVDDNGATGGPTTVSATTTYNFVYPYYYGGGAAALGAGVAALTKHVTANTNNYQQTITVTDGQKIYVAFPASYGTLNSILDASNFEVLSAFTATTADITGLDGNPVSYRIYESNSAVVAGSYFFQFKK